MGLPGPARLSLGTGEEGIFGRTGGRSGSLTFISEIESNQWLDPLEAGLGLGGGGTIRAGVPSPAVLLGVAGAVLAAIFSFLAFCEHSGQVTSLAFAD